VRTKKVAKLVSLHTKLAEFIYLNNHLKIIQYRELIDKLQYELDNQDNLQVNFCEKKGRLLSLTEFLEKINEYYEELIFAVGESTNLFYEVRKWSFMDLLNYVKRKSKKSKK
jgi:hypothetical protein